ncbi:MAG: amidase family protein [Novosphingobium sp.]|uniref:amidase family protein n=1 Tax=Novosphingobium sp. TaxID=1874826 RepID=UPI0030168E9C
MTPHEMIALSAAEAIGAMREGHITALAYAEALLARCAEGADLNAFITLDPEAVRAEARAADARRAAGETLGPLHGLPVPIKDSINTADLPTTAGTSALRQFYPAADAPVVARLRAAGAIVLGKTNLHELSLGWTSSNMAYGPVRNPWDLARIPGGSSGGSAATVAAGMAPLALAEDTEGSIRVPAALCGIAGFRPTTGRYPNDGCAPITGEFDQVGPVARHVSDLVLFDDVLTGDTSPVVAPPIAGLRLGIAPDYYFEGLDPAVADVVHDVIERLEQAGATIVRADLPGLGALIEAITLTVQIHDVVPSLTRWLAASGASITYEALHTEVSPDVKALLEAFAIPGAPRAIPEELYTAAITTHLPALRALFAGWFAENQVHAMLLPATMIPAPLIGDDSTVRIGGSDVPFEFAISRNIAPGSTAGLPGLVLPAGLAGGLPVAIELDGPAGSDRKLLGIGLAVEALLGPLPPPPAISVG